ncbi:hypothetical protein, partial [uncultured Microbacterium sp.]|uniref:hypothetical protein n=1 Tax=uncultured Microbacterium sp. TaxID=191216 RepID=UPI0025CCA34E
MSSRAGRAQRAVRGAAAAAVATFVATVSHGAVDSALPSAINVAVALCLATPVCVLLAGRTMSWWRLSTAIVLSQALFHGILALDLTGGGDVTAAHHGAATMAWDAVTPAHTAHSPWMWVAHAFAAVATIVALGRGERALQAIARFVVAVLAVLRPFRGLGVRTDAAPSAPEPPLL